MSTYFDFSIERKYKDKWICVTKSTYEDELDIINPWILKSAFWDADYSADISTLNEDELSDDTFLKFSSKLTKKNSGTYFCIDSKESESVIDFLTRATNDRRYKNNDVCLWFNLEYLFNERKDFLKSFLNYDMDSFNLEKYQKFEKQIDNAKESKDLFPLFDNCSNLIFGTNYNTEIIGIIFDDSPYSMIQNIKYSPLFKDIIINKANLIGYYEKDGITEKKQYELRGHVSYRKDIEFMLSEINDCLENMKKSNNAQELAKSYIYDILSEFENDESIKKTELYERLREYSETDCEYDSEYEDELKSQKKELELMLEFIGENGRLIWNIE